MKTHHAPIKIPMRFFIPGTGKVERFNKIGIFLLFAGSLTIMVSGIYALRIYGVEDAHNHAQIIKLGTASSIVGALIYIISSCCGSLHKRKMG